MITPEVLKVNKICSKSSVPKLEYYSPLLYFSKSLKHFNIYKFWLINVREMLNYINFLLLLYSKTEIRSSCFESLNIVLLKSLKHDNLSLTLINT